jgi:hypothetical protein
MLGGGLALLSVGFSTKFPTIACGKSEVARFNLINKRPSVISLIAWSVARIVSVEFEEISTRST